MATAKHQGKSLANAGKAQLIATLSKASPMNADAKVITQMAEIISGMGVHIPTKVDEKQLINAGLSTKSVEMLSMIEMNILTLVNNPNEWFLVRVSKKRGGNTPLRILGKSLKMVSRVVGDEVHHYAMFCGGPLPEVAKNKVKRLREKMVAIRSAAENGITLVPSKAEKTPTGKAKKKKKAAVKKSLYHAAKYPLTDEEVDFLRVLSQPNQEILVRGNSPRNEIFHAFRWKWKNYGFDFSQISIRQEGLPNGNFNIYMTYTLNADGGMNSGLVGLVDLLEKKLARSRGGDEASPKRESTAFGNSAPITRIPDVQVTKDQSSLAGAEPRISF